MTTSAPGFSSEVQTGITLTVGARQVLNFTLKVGQITQQIVVSGEAPTVELVSSALGAVVSSNTVEELPLNGRDWTQLGSLQPGVNVVPTQQALFATNTPRAARGYGNQMTISGTRPQLNNYRLDGVSIVDYSGGAPGSVLGVSLGVDAIAEFSVLTSNYSAEYGRTSGGVINAVTRSGTNQIHGDAFWFLRDEDFDARSFFDAQIPPFHRNQFGGSVGGPIRKDKAFFFVNYEGFRQDLGTTFLNNVPSQAARNGILNFPGGPATFPSGCIATSVPNQCAVTVNDLVKPYLAFFPLPNAGLIAPGNTGHFNVVNSNIGDENFVTARIDYKISEKDSVFGTFLYDKGSTQEPDAFQNELLQSATTRPVIVLEETHVFSPSLVNSLRVGFNRVGAQNLGSVAAINPLAADVSLGSLPGRTAPQIKVTGLTAFGGGLINASTPGWNSYQFYDDAFLTRRVHSLKFGFAFERMQLNTGTLAVNTGIFSFGSLANFLTNNPQTFQITVGTVTHGWRDSLFGGYLQDDWRWRPNLTLNLGLRYEMVTIPTEVNNYWTNLPTFASPSPRLGFPFFNNPTRRNFEPRVGFSWDPFHNGKTAVRGAFGIFDVLPLPYEYFNSQAGQAPYGSTLSAGNLAPGTFPSGAAPGSSGVGTVTTAKPTAASFEFNPHRNYLMIWNLNIQRQLTPSTTLTVGYVGNHGIHMMDRADDVNLVLPTVTAQGYLWPSPRGSGTKINPNFGTIRGVYWDGTSVYDALQLQVSKKMSHGFQAQGSYTWGKNIDMGSSSVAGDQFTNSISSPPFWFCRECRRALSDFNIAQSLVINYVWNVPTPKNWGVIASHVLGGWQLGGIFTAQTGVPMTPLIGGDPLGLNSNDPYDYPNRLTGPGCGSDVNPGNPQNYIKLNCFAPPNPLTLFGNSGRNSVVGPGITTLDFSLFKNIYIKRISENFDAQFRSEFFNILNKANFATPVANSTLFDNTGNPVGGAGAINQVSTTARQIQFALKLIW